MTEPVGIGSWPEMVEETEQVVGWWRRLVLVIELEVQVKMGLVIEEVKTRRVA